MRARQQGFTLIEILLVIVLITVLSAVVAPSFFQASGADVNVEARLLQKTLRLAAEESQLTGKTIRCSIYQDHLSFAVADSQGIWQAIMEKPLANVVIKSPVQVLEARLKGDVPVSLNNLNMSHLDVKGKEKPPMLRVLLWPDGRVSSASLLLGVEGDALQRTIELGSGLGGIRLLKAKE